MAAQATTLDFRSLIRSGLGVPLGVLAVLAMMVLPLPPFALDLLFTFNIAMALMVMMAAVYVMRPLDFAAFPAVMLLATLLRLALNVASTRVVLLHGHTGTAAAGKVIESFGDFVIGGNFAVGLIVFAILSSSTSSSSPRAPSASPRSRARFTLDAMPGKQMAIDADLNAGLITQEEASGAAPKWARRRSSSARWTAPEVRARRRDGGHPDPVHQHHRRLRRSASSSTTCPRRGGRDATSCSPSATRWSRRSRRC